MAHRGCRIFTFLALASLGLGACSTESAPNPAAEPVATASISGQGIERVPFSSEDITDITEAVYVIPNPHDSERDSDSGSWAALDWKILQDKVRWAEAERLDTLSFGAAIARMGRTFVGWTYTPQTLEVPGAERVVVNLRELDCVTFIENVLAIVRFQRRFGAIALRSPDVARTSYEGLLTEIRYRNATLDGYGSRLHYFSEWLSDNDQRGLVRLRTHELDPVLDDEAINFMSTHPGAYRQLAEPDVVEQIARIEERLSAAPRPFVPEGLIGGIADRIRDGDLIAATSTVAGLDIAHTGIAIRENGVLHLLHAPLVGSVVEISTLPLADRILEIGGQDGIMVAEPLPGDR